ncbi:hypothetical protein [Sandaracinus amylolyticus]|uniref:hypothetical protein n=1 Tax=Sandaracinus amylolyticus TaxID=927083 RepID=UPI001F364BE3|nr:hypothetical protein [Sandaracinus amylolyticus]UJR87034.1 Hypothetical protein I5071_91350 [Sandaracinus amylolyticus]
MSEVKHRLRVGPDLLAAMLVVVPSSLLVAIWLAPRAAIPAEIPPLSLDAAEARASIAQEHRVAAHAPTDDDARRRRELYEAQNLASIHGEPAERGEARRAELREVLDRMIDAHGEAVVEVVRAEDVERMIPALAGEGDDTSRAALLGDFREALERWGAIAGERRVAPDLVVRALYAARWNAVHGRPLTEGLDEVRLRAYHGWLALHGDAADENLRLAALDAYERAGGANADEARGVLAWRAGDAEAAALAFTRGHERTGDLRLRNHALAAAMRAAGPGDP